MLTWNQAISFLISFFFSFIRSLASASVHVTGAVGPVCSGKTWERILHIALCLVQGCSCTMRVVVMIAELLGIVFTFLRFALVVYISLSVSVSITRLSFIWMLWPLLFHDYEVIVYLSIDRSILWQRSVSGQQKKLPSSPYFFFCRHFEWFQEDPKEFPRPDGIYNPFSTFWVCSRGSSQVDMPRIPQQGDIRKAFQSNALIRVKKCQIQSWSFFWMSEAPSPKDNWDCDTLVNSNTFCSNIQSQVMEVTWLEW